MHACVRVSFLTARFERGVLLREECVLFLALRLNPAPEQKPHARTG